MIGTINDDKFKKILHYVCDNYELLLKNNNIDNIYKTKNYLNDKIDAIFCNYDEKYKKIIMISYIIYLEMIIIN